MYGCVVPFESRYRSVRPDSTRPDRGLSLARHDEERQSDHPEDDLPRTDAADRWDDCQGDSRDRDQDCEGQARERGPHVEIGFTLHLVTGWDATAYHKVSGPQTSWGRKVLARLALRGDERAIDAGCGSGRLTGELMDRLPNGTLVAIDRSWPMLIEARANLRPAFGARVRFAQVALPAMPFSSWADLVFSTATFHWISDHRALFRAIFKALRAGGRLHAQCGGGANLERAHGLAEQVMRAPQFSACFAGWPGPWEFASAETTAERLQSAGFININTGIEAAPTTFASESDYREFVTTVIYRPHLERLPSPELKQHFIDGVTRLAADDDPPFTLDYLRLNMSAQKP
jgi:trans-aconitate 2-methyltransferase